MKTGYTICKFVIFLKIIGDDVPADEIRSVFKTKRKHTRSILESGW